MGRPTPWLRPQRTGIMPVPFVIKPAGAPPPSLRGTRRVILRDRLSAVLTDTRAGPILHQPSSTVMVNVDARGEGHRVPMDNGHVRGRPRQCGANQGRPGDAER